jgi:hypothetical protein
MQVTHTVMYPVYVVIQVVDDEIHVSPSKAHISISENEEIVWECVDGTATITFPGDSPFHANNDQNKNYHVSRGSTVHTGKVYDSGKQRNDGYKYNVEVEINNRKYKKDPEVVVDP